MIMEQTIKQKTLQDLRSEFLKLLTSNSVSNDRRIKGYNEAIFEEDSGIAIFNDTDLSMVMEKMDKAISNIKGAGIKK